MRGIPRYVRRPPPNDPNVEPEDEYSDACYWKGQTTRITVQLDVRDIDSVVAFGLRRQQASQVMPKPRFQASYTGALPLIQTTVSAY